MPATNPTLLHNFHRFLGKKLESASEMSLTPEEALALWREEQDSIAAIREGLADVEACRTVPIAEIEQQIRLKFGFDGTK